MASKITSCVWVLVVLFVAGVRSQSTLPTCNGQTYQPSQYNCLSGHLCPPGECYCPYNGGCYFPRGTPNQADYVCNSAGAGGYYNPGQPEYLTATDMGVCPSSTRGDPLMTSFSGCQWYLQGEAGAVFNLISESQHVINTQLVPANLTDEYHNNDGTFHGAISIRYQDTVITASVDPQGNLTVRMMDSPVPFGAVRERQALTLKVTEFYPYYGQVAEIVTPAFRFFLHAVQPYDSPAGFQRGHLDMTASAIAGQLAMHGLLGQSDAGAGKLCPESMSFSGEGKESDYRMASLDSTDYTFGLFSAAKTTRRLHGMGNPVYDIAATPMTAGVGGMITAEL